MSIEQNIENLEIRNANVVTFVGTSSTMVDTISGRIQCKGFQHNSNVITDVSGPHGRVAPTLKKYPEIIFEEGKFDANESTNTYTQAGYKVTVSGFVNSSNHPWKAFNGIDSEVGMLLSGLNYDTSGNANTSGTTASRLSASDSTPYGEWLKLELPNKIKLDKYVFTSRNHATHWAQSVEAGQVWGSNNDSNWVHLHTFTNSGFTGESQSASFNVQTDNYYKYYAFIVTKTFAAGSDYYLCIPELKYYGYEEDPPAGDHSVDTTFKSRFNNPQLTGVQVFVDGKGSGSNQIAGGPVVTDTVESYDETGKYWNLTGELTSNISVEANTFLEGDQPHAVSVWFNSSNLEANTANTCVFSVSDQEKLDSVNLDLQPNTWHNLTYAYQGESGSRVTYLDGRKVAEDQAEDTFGDYPPFAMTGYSQGGYVVSSSGRYDGNTHWYEYEAFNKTTTGTNAHLSQGGSGRGLDYYNDGSGGYTRSPPATIGVLASTGATINQGEFLKIEMPKKIIVNYISQISLSDQPKDFKWYGSNDDYNWTQLTNVVDAPNDTNTNSFVTTAKGAFRYFAIVVSKVYTTTHQYFRLDDIRFYGHRENDLVRLPDPTNVLKYPHIAMTGPAQRGYVASASSTAVYNASLAPKNAFNGIISPSSATASWQSIENGYNSTAPYNYKASSPHTSSLSTSTTQYNGEWLSLQTPHKIKIQSYKLYINSDVSNYRPDNFVLLGSDTTTNGSWNLLHTETSATYTNDVYTATVNSNTSYKYQWWKHRQSGKLSGLRQVCGGRPSPRDLGCPKGRVWAGQVLDDFTERSPRDRHDGT